MNRKFYKIELRALYCKENGNLVKSVLYPDKTYFRELESAIKYLGKIKTRFEQVQKVEVALNGSYSCLMSVQVKYDSNSEKDYDYFIEEYVLSYFEFDDDQFNDDDYLED